MTEVLYPKATAVWLVDNTALTFDQIAEFCGLHPLEVKAIADGESARDIRGADPIATAPWSSASRGSSPWWWPSSMRSACGAGRRGPARSPSG